jgi:DNA replication protein DnaC
MFDRNVWLLTPDSVTELVTINPQLARTDQFTRWLDSLAPRFCRRHQRTRLLLDAEASLPPPPGDLAGLWYHLSLRQQVDVPVTDEARATLCPFEAVFRCPACRCAYALCPPEFHETSFDAFDTSTPERAAALERCRAFVAQVNQQRRGFALFVGPTGVGKTRLACNILRELQSSDALYVRQGQLTVALRATYGRKDVYLHRNQPAGDEANEPASPLDLGQQVGFLILDELGCNPLANDERLLLDELLKHRYDAGKPTLLISNLPLDQLKEFLGDALTDRVRHAAGNGQFILQFSGESFRRSGGESYLDAPAILPPSSPRAVGFPPSAAVRQVNPTETHYR